MLSPNQMGKKTFIAALALTAAPILIAFGQNPGGVMKKSLEKAGEMRTAGDKHDADVKAAQQPAPAKTAPAAPAPAPATKTTAAAPQTATKTAAPKTAAPKVVAPKAGMKAAAKTTAPKAAAKKGVRTAKAEPKAPEKRDPFVIPIKKTTNDAPVVLPSGNLGLMVGQANLVGVAKSPRGMIAMVSGPHDRTYFLRENDKIYMGRVVRITGDSMVLEETVIDPLGRTSLREVIKKISTAESKQ